MTKIDKFTQSKNQQKNEKCLKTEKVKIPKIHIKSKGKCKGKNEIKEKVKINQKILKEKSLQKITKIEKTKI